MAKKKKQEAIALPIEWNIPDYIITRFATNMIIQTIENEFKILFFEVKPTILISEEDREKLKGQTARADCIGSFIVTPDRLPKFIEVLNIHLEKYNKRREKKES